MATGLNMFSLVEELSSPAFRKIAALVSQKRGYPELPDYPTIPALPIVVEVVVVIVVVVFKGRFDLLYLTELCR